MVGKNIWVTIEGHSYPRSYNVAGAVGIRDLKRSETMRDAYIVALCRQSVSFHSMGRESNIKKVSPYYERFPYFRIAYCIWVNSISCNALLNLLLCHVSLGNTAAINSFPEYLRQQRNSKFIDSSSKSELLCSIFFLTNKCTSPASYHEERVQPR